MLKSDKQRERGMTMRQPAIRKPRLVNQLTRNENVKDKIQAVTNTRCELKPAVPPAYATGCFKTQKEKEKERERERGDSSDS